MSKRSAKASASSARAASTFGSAPAFGGSFGGSASQLSYVAEPPNLSAISDPNVVVFFRNLSKKDSTTKAKALEDLQTHIVALQAPVEEGVLDAWITVYPRTSIDNAKAVRQLSHTVHGLMAVSAGKRIARHMSRSVAAWLCGLYDGDRAVVEATQNALRQVFATPEKIQNIRKAYQQPILEYCRDAVDKESPTTLSDERTVSADDAQAKYSRVMSACIALLASLLANLAPEELSKFQADYDTLLSDKKLWDFASHVDVSIRRSLHRLLKTCLTKQPDAASANLETISKAYLSVALNSDQTGSAYDFLEALIQLTTAHPTAWTEHYKSKTSVDRRLRQFLKKGSQFGPQDYWNRLVDLFKALPGEVLPCQAPDAVDLLSALQAGIAGKNEPKYNQDAAYTAYFDVLATVNARLSAGDSETFVQKVVLPMISQYLRPSLETSQWSLPSNATGLLTKALAIDGVTSALSGQWPQYAQQLVNDIRTSAPEQSKDYEKSQTAVLQHGTRYATLQEHALKEGTASQLAQSIRSAESSIITEALAVVKNRNGKPYGAAGTIAALLSRGSNLAKAPVDQQLGQFIHDDLPTIILSPSSTQLVSILYSFAESTVFKSAWSATLKAILKEGDSPAKMNALEALLTSPKIPESFDLASSDAELQSFVKSSVNDAVEETTDDVLAYLTQSLSISQHAFYSLQGLRQIVKSNPSMLREFAATPKGGELLQALLRASESPNDEIAQGAATVSASIRTVLASDTGTQHSMHDLIHQGLREATPSSVSIETLVDLAKQSFKSSETWETNANLFPSIEDWDAALTPFLASVPKSALAITNSLGGATYLVEPSLASADTRKISRDADGYSAAYRIAQYVAKLSRTPQARVQSAPLQVRNAYLRNIALTVQLVEDNLGLAGANGLWTGYNADVENDAMVFKSDAQEFITQEITRVHGSMSSLSENNDKDSLLTWARDLLGRIDASSSTQVYYAARAYSTLVSDAIMLHGWTNSWTVQIQDALKTIRKNKQVIPLLAYLNAFREPLAASKSCERMCSEIVADLTGLDIDEKPQESLSQLVVLNTVLSQDGIAETIAKQRLIFFVKQIVPWLDRTHGSLEIRAEVCRALTVLLPLMSDLYGEHWGDILNALSSAWSRTNELQDAEIASSSPISFTHASLKLYAQLRTLTQIEDPNDDLIEVWEETEQSIAAGLINLLKHSQHFPDEFHQPLRMVNDVLARQIAKVPLEHLDSADELYPFLYVESQPVQLTAFNILHKQIPAAQEQISIDAALSKSTARFPEELLSLIIESPTVAALAEVNFERNVPLSLRGYLLSWLLVFDHLEHASFKVKNDYIEHIKEGEFLPGLLDFTFDFLGHAHNKPVDVSKLDITKYEPDVELPKQDTQWLLTHLYYLTLLHMPSLTKSWFNALTSRSRAIAVTLEPWTEKNISPPVITAALDSVTTWSGTATDDTFSIRVAPRAREITASYILDEQTMSMRISLPLAFPLANAHIEGLNRVAVNEQKWQSWLRTSLGAITIFNGSLIDALSTWRRNVEGALKGQTECAICYSIVGPDRKVPDKRCGTCRNAFHGACLFKWFKSSGSSSCPLCRNPFNYG
ncbi:zinc ion binding [Ascochyta rabiei]|uniref:E3 ubiquitin-protein ligase listerin n=1 Tax=Didymella rabiei TaxID=5454 RepID=A0A163EQ69_DIDRA|nr:zinc ion binding [Ascochyta rabiei]